MRHIIPALVIFCGATASMSAAPPAVHRDTLVGRLTVNEHRTIAELERHKPLVESYLQLTPPGSATPQGDEYSLARVDMKHVLDSSVYRRKRERVSLLNVLSTSRYVLKSMPLRFSQTALLDMLSPDIAEFDPAHYKFDYVRSGFLGARKVAIYDVTPLTRHSKGRFIGRIWVDKDAAALIRFTGVFEGEGGARPHFLHFDSWRSEIAPGMWMPTATYIEDTTAGSAVHGQLRMWEYDRDELVRRDDANTSMEVVDATDDTRNDISPLESLRDWRFQAEQNVVDELTAAGLLAPSGDFEKVLDQIVVNLAVPNNISLNQPIHCRVLLTTPIEATTIGNTILLSKGLIDTVPSVETLASVIAWQLAHIELEHTMDTRYAFSDTLMFPATDTYRMLALAHTDQDRAALLPQLSHGRLGDSLLAPDGSAWMKPVLPAVSVKEAFTELAAAPKPLGSSLIIDPWRDRVRWTAAPADTLTAQDIHPFHVLPYFAYPKQSVNP